VETQQDRPAIRVFWWQGGLHLEPTTDTGLALLRAVEEACRGGLNCVAAPTEPLGSQGGLDGVVGHLETSASPSSLTSEAQHD
jgi:hypothetical protein